MNQTQTDDFQYSEEDCAQALFRAKWPDGFRCPNCGHRKAYCIETRRLPLYECAKCHAQPSLIVGTVMQGTKLPLSSWFRAFRLHASPEGINALQLSQIISVTYKTAWLLCHKIRHAMSSAEANQLLTGLVKVTGTIYCNQNAAEHHFTWHGREHSLLIGVSETAPGSFDKIKLKLQNKHALAYKRSLPDTSLFIEQNVAPEAQGNVVVMSIQKKNRDIRVEHIALAAQRRLADLFRGVGPKHLQAYLEQFCYDWNWRGTTKFNDLLRHCAQMKTIMYKELIARTLPKNTSLPVRTAA